MLGRIISLSKFFILIGSFFILQPANARDMKKDSSGYAPINGINMYFEIHGQGNMALVLLHGGGSTIQSTFGSILPLLSSHGKIIAVELQAHGRTSDRNVPESFEQDADDVATLLKYLKIDKANFFGFSNGGTTTLQIAIRHPEIVNKIVSLAGAYRRDGFINGLLDGMQTATIDNMPAPLKEAFLKVTPDQNKLQTMFEKDRNRMRNFKDISDDALRSIKAPALMMVSDQDVVTVEHTLKMSQLIPGAKLAVLLGVHGECIGEICSAKKGSKAPEITATLIAEFLND